MCITPSQNIRSMLLKNKQIRLHLDKLTGGKSFFKIYNLGNLQNVLHMQNIPCTFRTAGSLDSTERGFRTISSHTTTVLLYFSVAGTCKENVLPLPVTLRPGVSNSVNSEPLSLQSIVPVVALQVKVTVGPSVALTDVGVVTKAGNKQIQCDIFM